MNGSVTFNVSTLVGLFGIISILSGVVGVAWVGLTRATIQTLKENNQALEDRVDILEKSDTEKTAKIRTLEETNSVLTDLLTNRVEIDNLVQAMQTHHASAEERYIEISKKQDQILKLLGDRRDGHDT